MLLRVMKIIQPYASARGFANMRCHFDPSVNSAIVTLSANTTWGKLASCDEPTFTLKQLTRLYIKTSKEQHENAF